MLVYQRVMWNIFSLRHPPFGESIGSKSKRIRRILPFSIISPYTHRRRTYPEWHPPQKMTSLGPEMGYTPRCNGKGTLWLLNITMEMVHLQWDFIGISPVKVLCYILLYDHTLYWLPFFRVTAFESPHLIHSIYIYTTYIILYIRIYIYIIHRFLLYP